MINQIIRFPAPTRKRDYRADMLKAAILEIRSLRREMENLKRMLPTAPFCEFDDNKINRI